MADPDLTVQVPEMRRIKQIHFVGIGGAGMCGIAEVLLNQGYEISGSDMHESATTRRLIRLGASVHIGHDAKHVLGVDVIVVSSAIGDDNQEIIAAHQARLPVVRRAEMLAELMRYRHGIAVAGTHGKTTTTSLIASIFKQASLDPTFIIGGLLNSAVSNARLGASRYLIAEADESDASFLHLQPMVAVLTNVDKDHLVNYEGSFEKLKAAFVAFVHNLPFYGLLVVCIDDPVIKSLLPRLQRPVLTYGFSQDADFQAFDESQDGVTSSFVVRRKQHGKDLKICLSLPGRHNVLNALAAVAIASDEGVADWDIVKGLEDFEGVSRRFQIHGSFSRDDGNFLLVDDYGHHPVEISAVMRAARDMQGDNRVIAVVQPHRYSRLKALFEDFCTCFNEADMVIAAPVYPAGESPIEGCDHESLVKGLLVRGHREATALDSLDNLPSMLKSVAKPGDMIVCLGAGDITAHAAGLESKLKALD